MAQQYRVRVLDESFVAPPPGSVSRTNIPLTFLDVSWLFCPPAESVLFYEFPHPTLHFTENIFPHLKQSLSLTLRYFFPFAGNLTCPPPPNNPYILYNEGNSIQVTLAQSDADFNHLTANYARDNTQFKCLVPTLPMTTISSDQTHVMPLMALQFTVFPNSGVSIGISCNHVAADGRSFYHFMKSWASIHRSESFSLPYHNRDVIKDPHGRDLFSIFMNDIMKWEISPPPGPATDIPEDNVRLTLVLSRAQIEKLKESITAQIRNDNEQAREVQPLHMSTFVATCAFMWVNLVKLQESSETTGGELQDDETLYHLLPADCREQFDEFPVPATYFGNCLALVLLSAKRSELMGENGIVFAATEIGRQIYELKKKGPLIGAEKWVSNLIKAVETGRAVMVSGSPRFHEYETDFGWGTPRKSEIVHIGANGGYSLAGRRDDQEGPGAIEIGIVIGRHKIDDFNVIFKQALNLNF
ncbi:putative Anthocyanin 5-aromatic acyltransferase [Melia azedarach]|uniref:Anthocyanin 5-aromatic acyltransferase n=1 Tax=Melia azedarach TaxID=155640 RepID=A0ACC1Y345_MELAZ|nr:putative Anthocyanin 5-aromatic acyltransferase [Melia azedarach]